MKRKVLSILMIGIMTFTLVSCGEKKDDVKANNEVVQEENVDSGETTESTETSFKEALKRKSVNKKYEDVKNKYNELAEKTKNIIEKSNLPYVITNKGPEELKEIWINDTKVNAENIDMGIVSGIMLNVSLMENEYQFGTSIQLDYTGKDSIDLMNTIIPEYYEAITGVKKDFTEISKEMSSKLKEETNVDKYYDEYYVGENIVRLSLGRDNEVFFTIRLPLYVVD